MKIEKWAFVKDNIKYAVSNTGLIANVKTQKVIKPFVNHKGYLIVSLYNNGKKKNMRIHRLVAEAFIPNPANLPEVDHKNGDRKDNNVENLRWVNGSTNTRNRDVCKNARSKFNGVSEHKQTGKWQAAAWVAGVNKYIGLFASEIEAAKAFNRFCIQNDLNRELNNIEEAAHGCN